MSAPAWLSAAGLATTAGLSEVPFDEPASSRWSGSFDRLPAHTWTVRLPGPPSQSATHTELGGPLIHGDVIYVGTANDDGLLALSRDDGRLLYHFDGGAPVQAAPVVEGDRLYFADAAGNTWCYDLATRDEVWSHFSGSPIVSTPRVADGRVFVADVGNVVLALDATSGELLWRHAQKLDAGRSMALELYGAPSPLPSEGLVLAGFSDGTLVALSADHGDVVWQRRVGEGNYPDIVAEPAQVGESVVVAGYSEPLVSIDLADRAFHWRLDLGGAQPPIVTGDGALVHGGGDGVLRSIDPRTGGIQWEFDSKTGTSLTRPVSIDAGIVVGASGGGLYVVDPDDGALLWRYEPLHHLSGITAPPAVDGRQLVVLTNAGNLVSFVAIRPDREDMGDVGPFARVLGEGE